MLSSFSLNLMFILSIFQGQSMRKGNLREAVKSETVLTELCPCDIRTNQFCKVCVMYLYISIFFI